MAPIIGLFIFAIFVVAGGLISHSMSFSSTKKKQDITRHEWKAGDSLQHGDCKVNTGDACLHNENNDTNRIVCRKCGFKNEKSASKCSVCGHKLWKF